MDTYNSFKTLIKHGSTYIAGTLGNRILGFMMEEHFDIDLPADLRQAENRVIELEQ